MPSVKIHDEHLTIELESDRTIGSLLSLAAEAMDCRRATGNWTPDMTVVALAPEDPATTTEATTIN